MLVYKYPLRFVLGILIIISIIINSANAQVCAPIIKVNGVQSGSFNPLSGTIKIDFEGINDGVDHIYARIHVNEDAAVFNKEFTGNGTWLFNFNSNDNYDIKAFIVNDDVTTATSVVCVNRDACSGGPFNDVTVESCAAVSGDCLTPNGTLYTSGGKCSDIGYLNYTGGPVMRGEQWVWYYYDFNTGQETYKGAITASVTRNSPTNGVYKLYAENDRINCRSTSYLSISPPLFYDLLTPVISSNVTSSTCRGMDIGEISGTAVYAVASDISYQWYVSEDVNTLFSSPVSGETGQNYTPEFELTNTIYVARRDILCGLMAESNILTFEVDHIDPPILSSNRFNTCLQNELSIEIPDNQFPSYEWEIDGIMVNDTDNVLDINTNIVSDQLYSVTGILANGCKTDPFNFNVVVYQYCDYSLNRIKTINVLKPVTNANTNFDNLATNRFQQKIEYYDGLGRHVQSVIKKGSPNQFDIIAPAVYDANGRQSINYLPYVSFSNLGRFVENPPSIENIDSYQGSEHSNFYRNSANVAYDNKPYSTLQYEKSPLNRVIKGFGPGQSWLYNNKFVEYSYELNSGNEVRIWKITNDLPASTSSYTANSLHKNISKDEEGFKVIEFINSIGQIILKRVQANESGTSWADTYNVYDDFGNIRFVFPPEFINKMKLGTISYSPTQMELNNWAYQYSFDEYGRIIEKRVPGVEPDYYLYDKRDRLILTQNGNQRNPEFSSGNEWMFTKYDIYNRPILTGKIDMDSKTKDQLKTEIDAISKFYETMDGASLVHGYTNLSYPNVPDENDYLTVMYYDDYDIFTNWGTEFTFDDSQLGCVNSNYIYCFPSIENKSVQGKVTGSKVKVMTNNSWIKTVVYYDDKYRPIQSISGNDYQLSTSRISNLYDFVGGILKTNKEQTVNGNTINILNRYEYDHSGRLLRGFHEIMNEGISNGEVLLAENSYNELGQLIEKNLHVENNIPLQSIDYRYNIRGWLENINNSKLIIEPGRNEDDVNPDLFGMNIFYNH